MPRDQLRLPIPRDADVHSVGRVGLIQAGLQFAKLFSLLKIVLAQHLVVRLVLGDLGLQVRDLLVQSPLPVGSGLGGAVLLDRALEVRVLVVLAPDDVGLVVCL